MHGAWHLHVRCDTANLMSRLVYLRAAAAVCHIGHRRVSGVQSRIESGPSSIKCSLFFFMLYAAQMSNVRTNVHVQTTSWFLVEKGMSCARQRRPPATAL
eukprot:scaffold324207_cov52-Tisochrysis_lutea.AAC.2